MSSGVIKANGKGKVYVTPWKVSANEAQSSLFAGNPMYKGKGDYVIEMRIKSEEDWELIIGRRKGGGHISLSGGDPVIAAGEVKFVDGVVKSINNKSGHYKPSGKSAQQAALKAFGVENSSLYTEIKH